MKYKPLQVFLAGQERQRIRMSFDEVERAAQTRLPASAYKHPAWWANDATAHVQAKAWLEAGYKTEQVDLENRRVEFVRMEAPRSGVREMKEAFEHREGQKFDRHPMIGAMKGTFTIAPGWDLTRPALDAEELEEWEASLDRKADRYLKGPRG